VTLSSGSCTLVILFSPTTIGNFSQTLSLSYNDGNSTQTTSTSLSGVSVAQAILSFTIGSSYDFGDVLTGVTKDYTLTLLNGGSTTATAMSGTGLIAPFSFKGGSYPGTGGTCGISLTSAATCTVVVSYNSAGIGNFSNLFQINFNDGINTTLLIATLYGQSSALILPALVEKNIPLQSLDLKAFVTQSEFIDKLLEINSSDPYFRYKTTTRESKNLGTIKLNLGDITNDKIDDYLIGFPLLNYFVAYDGFNLKELYKMKVKSSALSFGISAVLGLDHDGDGIKDIKTALYEIDKKRILKIKSKGYFSSKTGKLIVK